MTNQETIKIEGTVRETTRQANKVLRDELRVPAVLYGPEIEENIHFSVDELELEKILRRRQTKVQELTVDGNSYRTLLKRVEFDPVTDRPLHADFYVLTEGHKVTLRVPVTLTGAARGVVDGGGRLFQPMKVVRIRVYPDNIPSELTADISDLDIGESIHVGDLDLEGITPLDAEGKTIVTVRPPKGADFLESLVAGVTEEAEEAVAEEAEELAEGEEPAEGEEAEGEAGEEDESTEE